VLFARVSACPSGTGNPQDKIKVEKQLCRRTIGIVSPIMTGQHNNITDHGIYLKSFKNKNVNRQEMEVAFQKKNPPTKTQQRLA